MYTISEASKILKTNKNCIYDLVRHGHLKVIKYGSLKVPAKEIERFIEKYIGYDLSNPSNPKKIEQEVSDV